MKARVVGLVVAVAAVGGGVALARGDDGYSVYVPLRSGYGLEDGSAVRIGGVSKGKVKLKLAEDDTVTAELTLDKDAGKVGKNARVSVVAANFLGQKRVDLDVGDVQTDPAPTGFTLSGDSVSSPTDLDQLLGVFDADTRVRARILINGLGEAVVGRKTDISKLLHELPAGFDDLAAVVDQLSTDNITMRALLRRSDNFIAETVRKRGDLGRMIEVLADTSSTVAAKRVALRQTLARAPGTLRTLRSFSQDLYAAAGELSPAAREIAATAPPLESTLAKVEGVRKAADPALRTATDLAPQLTRLADGATSVVRRAAPNARSLARLSTSLEPVSQTVNRSFDNVIAILDNWSHAIQFRDGLGHVFRGEASFSPDAVLGAVEKLVPPVKRKRSKTPAAKPNSVKPSGPPAPAPSAPTLKVPNLKPPPLGDGKLLEKALDSVGQLVGGLTGGAPAGRSSGSDPALDSLLDYLLKP